MVLSNKCWKKLQWFILKDEMYVKDRKRSIEKKDRQMDGLSTKREREKDENF